MDRDRAPTAQREGDQEDRLTEKAETPSKNRLGAAAAAYAGAPA